MKISVKLTKAQLDEKIESILQMKELVKALQEDIKNYQTIVESNFELSADQRETLMGNKYIAEKIPTNLGKNDLDYNAATQLLNAEELALVTKTVIDVDKLKAFIKAKAIDECLIPMIREDRWTFKTVLKHIENVNKEKILIKDNKIVV